MPLSSEPFTGTVANSCFLVLQRDATSYFKKLKDKRLKEKYRDALNVLSTFTKIALILLPMNNLGQRPFLFGMIFGGIAQ